MRPGCTGAGCRRRSAAGSDEAKALTTLIFQGIDNLYKSAAAGNVKAAKADYVDTAGALEAWAKVVGLAGSVKGL